MYEHFPAMTKMHNPFPRLTSAEGEEKFSKWHGGFATQSFNGNVYHYTSVACLSP